MNRRRFLKNAACCLAGSSGMYRALAHAAAANAGTVLRPERAHHPARAKHLIFVFLTGGMSHVDTFDPKPALSRDHGRTVTAVHLRATEPLPLLRSPFRFIRHGQSGLEFSELFPHLGSVADDLCVIRTLHTDIIEHFQAVLAMHTGSSTVPMPSIGAWLSYGLGTRNPNLPAYLVFAEHLPYAGSQVWDSNFLPPLHQGVRLQPGPEPIPNLRSPARTATLQDLEQRMLADANEMHARSRPGDLNLRARMHTFEVARGMMREAPEVFDLAQESEATHRLYGLSSGDRRSFAYQCLMARRLVERGVRVVELIDTGASDNWDAHGDMQNHRGKAARVDHALAGLIYDLKQRGLLNETLVAVCTEFGRTPWTDNAASLGRNHFVRAFSCLLAGGGVKGGMAFGQTDEYGANIVENPCHVHDYHATILHLMGIDHTRLTYRYAGRDFRLTDVHGRVVENVIM
ncbi:MAG: DUF1501 domain-containing protein [Planctomycetes bacterium]|nr:DUF1501 domain-containing protein [Planctomycetota bacterium]